MFYKHKRHKDGLDTQCKICVKQYYTANRETIRAKAQAKRPPPVVRTRKSKEEVQARQTAYVRERRRTNRLAKLRANVGSLIANVLALQGYKKTTKSAQILGCSFEQFQQHIEQQFSPGMSWDNREQWDLDHIVPVKFASTEQELILLNHYTNLRPLWRSLNQSKASTLTEDSLNHPIYKQIMDSRKYPV